MPFNSTQNYYHISDKLLTKYWFHFTATCNNKDLMQLISPKVICHLSPNTKRYNNILKYMKKAISSHDNTLFSVFQQKHDILTLLAYFLEYSGIDESPIKLADNSNIGITDTLAFIHNNYNTYMTIDALSKMKGLSNDHFIRYFKNETGMTPINYINNVRVNHAKHLLQSTSFLVGNISKTVGFSSVSYFTRTFKKYTGFSPLEYRKVANSKVDLSKYLI